jgi:hypothetical protein
VKEDENLRNDENVRDDVAKRDKDLSEMQRLADQRAKNEDGTKKKPEGEDPRVEEPTRNRESPDDIDGFRRRKNDERVREQGERNKIRDNDNIRILRINDLFGKKKGVKDNVRNDLNGKQRVIKDNDNFNKKKNIDESLDNGGSLLRPPRLTDLFNILGQIFGGLAFGTGLASIPLAIQGITSIADAQSVLANIDNIGKGFEENTDPTFNKMSDLVGYNEGLAKGKIDAAIEGSTDGRNAALKAIIKQNIPKISMGEKDGYIDGKNKGISDAKGDIINLASIFQSTVLGYYIGKNIGIQQSVKDAYADVEILFGKI